MTAEQVIAETQNWIKSVIVGLNFCPFAARVVIQNGIYYCVLTDEEIGDKEALKMIEEEFKRLDNDPAIETSFVIFADSYNNFDDYLTLVNKTNRLITKLGYDGIYQVASFHPDYVFEGSDDDDAANYTNRSIYPMLHLLREASLTKALATYKNPEAIPERNINLAREKGIQYMQALREACFK